MLRLSPTFRFFSSSACRSSSSCASRRASSRDRSCFRRAAMRSLIYRGEGWGHKGGRGGKWLLYRSTGGEWLLPDPQRLMLQWSPERSGGWGPVYCNIILSHARRSVMWCHKLCRARMMAKPSAAHPLPYSPQPIHAAGIHSRHLSTVLRHSA
jgi:hypothetical protein